MIKEKAAMGVIFGPKITPIAAFSLIIKDYDLIPA